jgi:hypothetical protein
MGPGDVLARVKSTIGELRVALKRRFPRGGGLAGEEGAPVKAPDVKFVRAVRIAAVVFGVTALTVAGVFIFFTIKTRAQIKDNLRVEAFPQNGFPRGDLFLPREPNFLPPVILAREPRELWTAEDAEEFWTDPMTFPDGNWEKRVGDYVDALMESVP